MIVIQEALHTWCPYYNWSLNIVLYGPLEKLENLKVFMHENLDVEFIKFWKPIFVGYLVIWKNVIFYKNGCDLQLFFLSSGVIFNIYRRKSCSGFSAYADNETLRQA